MPHHNLALQFSSLQNSMVFKQGVTIHLPFMFKSSYTKHVSGTVIKSCKSYCYYLQLDIDAIAMQFHAIICIPYKLSVVLVSYNLFLIFSVKNMFIYIT